MPAFRGELRRTQIEKKSRERGGERGKKRVYIENKRGSKQEKGDRNREADDEEKLRERE